MTTAFAIIGAQYGDEGKGAYVDRLASLYGDDALVVRSNGGAQAAHTVMSPDGERHVFSHFGSGTFAGARTHLSKFMICNPIFFLREYEELGTKKAPTIKVSVSPDAMVSIPLDSLINQSAEVLRGHARHGSCGHGIGETVERNEKGFIITVADLKTLTVEKLHNIRDRWLKTRMAALGFTKLPDEYQTLVDSDGITRQFIDDCQQFLSLVELVPDSEQLRNGPVIFEGAQGLRLDQDMGDFPHVTRSYTGIRNISALAKEAEIDTLLPYYLTRSYVTRHGAGPLEHEQDISEFIDVHDPTNVPNDWQGSLRFAPLDIVSLFAMIDRDLKNADGVQINPAVAVTCLDQIGSKGAPVVIGEETHQCSDSELIGRVTEFMMDRGKHWAIGQSWSASRV